MKCNRPQKKGGKASSRGVKRQAFLLKSNIPNLSAFSSYPTYFHYATLSNPGKSAGAREKCHSSTLTGEISSPA